MFTKICCRFVTPDWVPFAAGARDFACYTKPSKSEARLRLSVYRAFSPFVSKESRHMSDRRILGLILSAAILALPACASRNADTADSSSESSGFRLPSLPNPLANNRPVEAEGIGVNGFLWRASLDTISFMPLAEVDPFGGVIVTDWYANPQMANERFKLTVYILDTRLRADALAVSAFRQVRSETGEWIDAETGAQTAYDIENAILTRARQLRISQLEN
ncbi:DUF3576 domain-containing protein [Maricaulis maris]|uniref:DUF3576 domain-containing protein n=1 Tax=Maricaulis maris TaxID=74318 RepID=UPI0030C66520